MRENKVREKKRSKMTQWTFCMILIALLLCVRPVRASETENGTGTETEAETEKGTEKTSGQWVTKNSHRMYLQANGTYAKDTWLTIDGGKYLFDENGYALFGLQTWKGNQYYIRKNSGMVTGWLIAKKGTYYFLKSGKMVRKRWLTIENNRYYILSSGKMARGWRTLNGKTYYFKRTNGKMATGLQTINGSKYYFTSKGVRVTSKWITINGKKYYFKKTGKMATGWLTLGKKTYYLGADGARVTGEQLINGKTYYFNEKGIYDPDPDDSIDPTKPMVALTYDDGPSRYTNRLLNYLEENDAVATFFLVGQSISSYKSTVRRAYKLGCEIGSHTWDHAYLTSLSTSQIASELSKTNAQIKAITGKNATLVRPPYGAYNKTVLANLNAPAITWSIDTRDWEHRNASMTISNVMNNVKDGDIILMHDLHKQTVDAAKTLIPKLKKAGYQLVTVSQLAKYKNITLQNGKVYSSIR